MPILLFKSVPHRSSMISISIGLTSVPMSTGQIKKLTGDDWIHCHGPAPDGTQVNSLSINQAADSILIRDRHGEMHAFDKNEFRVAIPEMISLLGMDKSSSTAQA